MQLSVMMMFNGQSTWEMTRRKRDRDTKAKKKSECERKQRNVERELGRTGKGRVTDEARGGEEKGASVETLIKEVRGL